MSQFQAIDVNEYYDVNTFERIKSFAQDKPTPFVVIDTQIIAKQYDDMVINFPYANIYYAVKANPAPEVLSLLWDKGACFDIASIYELDMVTNLGVTTDRVSYGNTIKKRKDVRAFFERGVRMFASDSEADLRMLAEEAPGARVYVRILTEGTHTADWPLSRKFGCQNEMAYELLVLAKELGLVPYGISFHVGSQQRDIGAWDSAIGKVKGIFERLNDEHGIKLQMINLGGGFPANYLDKTNELAMYAAEITHFLKEDFGDDLPEIILEPGRSLLSNAGVLVSEVVLISKKSHTALERWVFTDVGKFSGLIETMDEAIKFPIYTERQGELDKCVIAGPTCDSADIMYEHYSYGLPTDLAIGDRMYWLTAGAYTTTYSAVCFNGFPPLKDYYL
ncbi:type III PLP-dependent enzyme [Shewanella sp. Isolate11]|uniref:type III PLP-dependent enzyme n=1 Tax=Shewanella sp. Isolate11 TaxID=2908530 RepID=UPI001EFD2C07|nr:type III PLP-dependent enzyme [Shewanella sp. Isolate11]MCG9698243.1 type III PLP-dependent enzyme [Shewanella sp. Isolate11]